MISEYSRYGHELYELKSKKYLAWFKNKYPHLDAHHLLRKKIDYLVFPFRHSEHLQTVHSHKAFYFEKYLVDSVNIFLVYVKEKFNEKIKLSDYEPATLRALFERVQQLERNR
jgi:hypothetical protein